MLFDRFSIYSHQMVYASFYSLLYIHYYFRQNQLYFLSESVYIIHELVTKNHFRTICGKVAGLLGGWHLPTRTATTGFPLQE